MNKFERKVLSAVRKRLPFKSPRATKEMLEFAADDMVDAYRIGAEEAQAEIESRICALFAALADTKEEG